jgi:23S rRNA (guanosine2251-2'-O)-methyltransferase
MTDIVLIAHNVRSTHNVGSLLRTSDGLGAKHVYLTGYTPHPTYKGDPRLPHESERLTKQIKKTALGAEQEGFWTYNRDIQKVLENLKQDGYTIVGLEQAENAVLMTEFKVPRKLAIIVGREVEGIEQVVLDMCDHIVEIQMFGKKESFNVGQAAAMALYYCRFYPFA